MCPSSSLRRSPPPLGVRATVAVRPRVPQPVPGLNSCGLWGNGQDSCAAVVILTLFRVSVGQNPRVSRAAFMWKHSVSADPKPALGLERAVKIISWNVAHRSQCWKRLLEMDAGVALPRAEPQPGPHQHVITLNVTNHGPSHPRSHSPSHTLLSFTPLNLLTELEGSFAALIFPVREARRAARDGCWPCGGGDLHRLDRG